MSPSDPDAPGGPPEPAEYKPKPLMSLGFWVAMAFALLSILAGVAVVKLGPTLFPARPAAQPAAPPPASNPGKIGLKTRFPQRSPPGDRSPGPP